VFDLLIIYINNRFSTATKNSSPEPLKNIAGVGQNINKIGEKKFAM